MAGSKEFTYDNTYKTKSDIDLCITYYDFFRAGKYQLCLLYTSSLATVFWVYQLKII